MTFFPSGLSRTPSSLWAHWNALVSGENTINDFGDFQLSIEVRNFESKIILTFQYIFSELPEDLSTQRANFHNSRVPGGVLKLYRSKLF